MQKLRNWYQTNKDNRAEDAEMRAKLNTLTDPTLITRMYFETYIKATKIVIDRIEKEYA